MNKYLTILIATLSLMMISGQASAHYWRTCDSWWKNGVKYTHCNKAGYGYHHRGYHRGYHYGVHHGHHYHHHHHHHGHHP